MSIEEIEQRQAHFKEFGEILVRRHGQNHYSSYHNQNRVTVDEAAVRFGRYLRASRCNANLSVTELASQAKISEATLIALEQGLILACDIKPRWLKRLTKILAENIEDFDILLGRKNSYNYNNSHWFTKRWGLQYKNLLACSKVSSLSKPVYGFFSIILFCFVVGIFFFMGVDFFEQPPPKQDVNSSIIVEPKHRPNLFRADPGLEQASAEPFPSRSLPIQAHNSSGIARRY